MVDLDGRDAPVALRTPLYLIISLFGAVIFVAAFLPWAGVRAPSEGAIVGGPSDQYASSVSGLEAGGWGLSALIAGAVIAGLGVLGYFWNPFSDPEAALISFFAAVTAVAALFKLADAPSLFPVASDFDAPSATTRFGLWLVVAAAVLAMLSGLWILFSRPRAQTRLAS